MSAIARSEQSTAGSPSGGSARDLLGLIASGRATSRSELVRSTGLAASTVSMRVEELIEAGLIAEDGLVASRGGRRARSLTVNQEAGYLLICDLGSRHARVVATDLAGAILTDAEHPLDLGVGPEKVADRIRSIGERLAARPEVKGRALRGGAVAIPGPVDWRSGRVVSPSRMPRWHDCAFGEVLGRRLGVPVVIENDANLIALGILNGFTGTAPGTPGPAGSLVVVKVGGGIGGGLIADGRLYRGVSGAAGDISHNRVSDAGDRPCSCGNTGCLETIASGAALISDLSAAGLPVESVADILELLERGDPTATTAIRNAGRQIGEVVAMTINFTNPEALFLAGLLSVAEPLVAAVRSVIYERCLPAVTRTLTISAVGDRDLNIRAAAGLALQRIPATS